MKKKFLNWYNSFTEKVANIQSDDKQKLILNTLFHEMETADSVILFNKVQEAFVAELTSRKADAIEEHRLISTFFREGLS